jgi:copper chaperone CopZ
MKTNILMVLLLAYTLACQSGTKSEKGSANAEVALTEISFSVGGMTCTMCEASIEKGVGQMAGIDSVNVVLDDSIAFVRFNPQLVSEAEITKTIELRGYTVKGKL